MQSKLLLFLIFATFAFSACQSAGPANPPANAANQIAKNTANAVNSTTVAANTAQTANQTANAANVAAQTGQTVETNTAQQTNSPAGTFKAIAEAAGKKDVESLRQLYSRKSLDMFSSQAKEQGKTLEDVLLNQRTTTIAKTTMELRNQIIDGPNATIEVLAAKGGRWETVYFILEDGHWKIAMDRYMEEMIRQVEESTKELERR